jgi:hypothetical protein
VQGAISNSASLITALAALIGAVAAFSGAWQRWRKSHRRHAEGKTGASAAGSGSRSGSVRVWFGVGITLTLVAVGFIVGWAVARSNGDDTALTAQRLNGHWYGQFGNIYFQVRDDEVRAVYDYQDGRVLGTLHDGVVDGWWNELPTRNPDNNAGLVHFDLVKGSKGAQIDGWWLYGTSGNTQTWDLRKLDDNIPIIVQAKFEDSGSFKQQPP